MLSGTVAFQMTGAVRHILSMAVTLWILAGKLNSCHMTATHRPLVPTCSGESQLLYTVLSHQQESGETHTI